MNRRSFLKSFLAAAALSAVPKVVSAAAAKVASEASKAIDFVKSLPVVNVIDGKWHHIALSRGGSELKTFVDGEQVRDVEGIGVDLIDNKQFSISLDPVLPGAPTTPIMSLKFRNSSEQMDVSSSDFNCVVTSFDIPEIDPNSDFTMEFWAKSPELSQTEHFSGQLDEVRLTVGVERDIVVEYEKQKTVAERFSGIPFVSFD